MKSFSKKIIFFENIFRRLVCTKKLQKEKMQLSPESSNVQSSLPDSGEHIWSNPAKIAGFRSDSSGSGQIWPDPTRFSWNLVRRHPATVTGCRRIPVPAVFL
jgi:hypothetical protein